MRSGKGKKREEKVRKDKELLENYEKSKSKYKTKVSNEGILYKKNKI